MLRPLLWVKLMTVGMFPFLVQVKETGAEQELVLAGSKARLTTVTSGGGIVEFRFLKGSVNPLNWEITEALESRRSDEPHLRGHFLCLDRWGQPSDSEVLRGVPFHGEAPRREWNVIELPAEREGRIQAVMACGLPIAGLHVSRRIQLAKHESIALVSESVTNVNQLGRIYNMVQHPTIAPPFLDESTRVDSNATYGFEQDEEVPLSFDQASLWPKVRMEGKSVNLHRFFDRPNADRVHDVSSFVVDSRKPLGWVTACNPGQNILIGYLWKPQDYPWLNIWRYRFEGKVAARGLEFGTTGYHQPFPVLVKTNRILDQTLYSYIDADQTVERSYAVFLMEIPNDFQGVENITINDQKLKLVERRDSKPRTIVLTLGQWLLQWHAVKKQ